MNILNKMLVAGADIGVNYAYCVVKYKRCFKFYKLKRDEFQCFVEGIVKNGGIVAIDGPQGLSGNPKRVRIADAVLNTPVKCGYNFPPSSNPYSAFVRLSIAIFYSLFKKGFKLLNASTIDSAKVLETYPAEIWKSIGAGFKKRSREGINERKRILKRFGINFSGLPSDHNFIDAAVCMLTSYFYTKGEYTFVGAEPFEDEKRKILREGWLVLPFIT